MDEDPHRSPSDRKRQLEFDLAIEERKFENNLQCCCTQQTTDKRIIQMTAKLILSISVLGFSFQRLIVADECNNLVPFWTGLISMIVGGYLGENIQKKK